MDDPFEIATSDESFTEVAAAAKDHECNICFFRSKYKSSLTRHMKLHSACNESSNREARPTFSSFGTQNTVSIQ